jgi:hypothetical protein
MRAETAVALGVAVVILTVFALACVWLVRVARRDKDRL